MNNNISINKNKNRDVFYKTRGFCPVCRKLVSAEVFKKNKSMFIEKNCQKHGKSEAKIAKYAWDYKELHSFYEGLYGKSFYRQRKTIYSLVDINSKCNLQCNICYAGTSG
ncbi:MAG: hypothetical protein PHW15_03080 [Patescibacteria group bacterium]|nr:hypothetical protein [Patescibacteria group bacterium]